MEILSYFFDVFVAACIRFACRKPRAEPVERCLACEADSAGTTECDGRWWGNERMGFMGRMRLYMTDLS
jgi:hypothetical protein